MLLVGVLEIAAVGQRSDARVEAVKLLGVKRPAALTEQMLITIAARA